MGFGDKNENYVNYSEITRNLFPLTNERADISSSEKLALSVGVLQYQLWCSRLWAVLPLFPLSGKLCLETIISWPPAFLN